jgi:hypothetical protein
MLKLKLNKYLLKQFCHVPSIVRSKEVAKLQDSFLIFKVRG